MRRALIGGAVLAGLGAAWWAWRKWRGGAASAPISGIPGLRATSETQLYRGFTDAQKEALLSTVVTGQRAMAR